MIIVGKVTLNFRLAFNIKLLESLYNKVYDVTLIGVTLGLGLFLIAGESFLSQCSLLNVLKQTIHGMVFRNS